MILRSISPYLSLYLSLSRASSPPQPLCLLDSSSRPKSRPARWWQPTSKSASTALNRSTNSSESAATCSLCCATKRGRARYQPQSIGSLTSCITHAEALVVPTRHFLQRLLFDAKLIEHFCSNRAKRLFQARKTGSDCDECKS